MKFLKFMIKKISILFILLLGYQSLLFSQTINKVLEEEIWTVVEKRNATWKDGDFDGHSKICHPDFMALYPI